MSSNYDTIRGENIREYGEGTRHLSFLGRLYSDRTHFIFELLQNAEDAEASRILFRLFEDRLEVRHDGRPFDVSDVIGVCGVGEGTKAENLTQIGKFGIGFKSVYAYTSTPEVHSGNESFRIENYVRPYPVQPKKIGDSWTTLFVFTFDTGGIDPETACREIGERLRNLSARTLLFLRKIREIEFRLPNVVGGVYLRKEVTRGPARHVTVIGQNNSRDEEENWLIFERLVPVPDGSYNVRVEVGFWLKNDGRDKDLSVTGIKDASLVVYFPTERATRFGFLIQGPYRTTPARDNIPKDDGWNKALIAETAQLVVVSLRQLRDMGLLSVSLLEALPIRMDDFPNGSMFYPIVVAVREALMNEDLLPADDETFVSARNAKLARGTELRKLLNQDQLRSLYPALNTVKWLAGGITQDRAPDLRFYLLDECNIEEVTPDSLARKLNQSFLVCQTDDWFIGFYRYLSGQEALWRSPRWRGDLGGILRTKPILRLNDGSQVPPFRPDGRTPNAFLPPPDVTDFPIVKREIVSNEQVGDFLKRLGLSEPDIYDDVVERLLPRYRGPEASSISQHEHRTNIQKILRAMGADSEAGRKKVTREARQTPFLLSVDKNGTEAFRKAEDIYFPTREISDYFLGASNVWFLQESEGEETWRELGVVDKPRFQKIIVHLPSAEKRKLIGSQGHTRDIGTIDYELDGLENYLSIFSKDRQHLDGYALILWNFLLEYLGENSHYRFFEGEYKWFYYQERVVEFEASWRKQLRSHAWLPKQGDDHFYLSSELRIDDLPVSFARDEKLANLLGMKKDDLVVLAKEKGLPLEDIDLIKQHPAEFARWKDDMAARSEKPSFPARAIANLERRQERIIKQLADAPMKEYEEREKLIRITRGSVDPALWLRNQYTNDESQMICQLCKKVMPFKKRDSELFYFEAVEALSKDYFPKEHEAQFLALCPLCAAKYKEFVKGDENAMKGFLRALESEVNLEIPLSLGEEETSIRFVESHWQDMKTILQEKS